MSLTPFQICGRLWSFGGQIVCAVVTVSDGWMIDHPSSGFENDNKVRGKASSRGRKWKEEEEGKGKRRGRWSSHHSPPSPSSYSLVPGHFHWFWHCPGPSPVKRSKSGVATAHPPPFSPPPFPRPIGLSFLSFFPMAHNLPNWPLYSIERAFRHGHPCSKCPNSHISQRSQHFPLMRQKNTIFRRCQSNHKYQIRFILIPYTDYPYRKSFMEPIAVNLL